MIFDPNQVTPSGKTYAQIDAEQADYVKAANVTLASMRDKGARWWTYSVSHSTFELVVGDLEGIDNLVLSLPACDYIAGPVSWPNQQLQVIWRSDRSDPNKVWEFVLQDESAGFRAVAAIFTWRRNFNLSEHGSIWFGWGSFTLSGERYARQPEFRAAHKGTVKLENLTAIVNEKNERVAVSRHGRATIWVQCRELDIFSIPYGAVLLVEEGQEVAPGQRLCYWDPHTISALAEVGGRIRFDDLVEGETLRREKDSAGVEHCVIPGHKGDLHPQIIVEDENGQALAYYYIPEGACLEVREGEQVSAGTVLARVSRTYH
jgi:hypothetical protein